MQNEKQQLIGLVIEAGEKNKLRDICLKYGIPVAFPEVFEDGKFHPMWGLSEDGIGLLGTEVMRRLPKVLHGVDELIEYLDSRH